MHDIVLAFGRLTVHSKAGSPFDHAAAAAAAERRPQGNEA